MAPSRAAEVLRRLMVAALLPLLAGLGFLEPFERWIGDRRAELASRPASERVIVVGIDAEAQAVLGRWPWPRRLQAELVRRLIGAGALRVGLDVDLSAPGPEPDDRALAAVLASAGPERVALAGYRQNQPMPEGPARLAETVPAASLGRDVTVALVDVVPDADGLVRAYPSGAELGGSRRASLAHWLTDAPSVPGTGPIGLDWAIDVATIPYLSAADLLAPDFDPAWVAGRLVLVGAVDPALGDMVAVPRWRVLPGVFVHALAAETLVQERIPWGPGDLATSLLLAGLLAAFGPRLERATPRAVAIGGAALLVATAGSSFWAERLWSLRLPLAGPVAAWLLALAVATAATLRRLHEARARAAREAERRRRLLEGIVAESFDGILTLTPDGRIATANPAAGALFDLAPEALGGRRLAELAPALEAARAAGPGERREATLALPGGRRRTVEIAVARLHEPVDGVVDILVLRDVSQARATAIALDRLLHRDEETGLPNRRRYEELLEAQLREASGDRFVACLVVDSGELVEPVGLDDPNASAGPLAALAAALGTRLPPGTIVARVAPDTLACLPPGPVGAEAAAEVASLARAAAADAPPGAPAPELLRIGLALGPSDAADGRGLLRCALLAARRGAAPGGWARYAAAQDRSQKRRGRVLSALRAALAADRLRLVYQPEIDTWTGVPVAVEALLRWHDPELGPLAPSEFVPLAEEAGLVEPLTRFVVRRAVADRARLAERGLALPVAVNLSARSLEGPQAAGTLARLLAEAGGTPDRLQLEITETAVARSGAEALACLLALREAGYAVALDDFGVGYSSFARLRDLPVSTLKIDRALVRVRPGDRGGDLVLQTVVELAERLGLATVGEGVEEPADLERLKAAGCTLAQGYHVAPPMPVEELAGWLEARILAADPVRAPTGREPYDRGIEASRKRPPPSARRSGLRPRLATFR
jgi:predicted signal transduction protein with EAL and GGDEF domain/CHASE2 domain-containing sensor protein